MRVDLIKRIQSSFLSCEKDAESVVRKLFMESQPHSNILKKLLVINNPDCLDNPQYDKIIEKISVKDLIDRGYIRFIPKVEFPEHEEVKSYIIISFDNFYPNPTNPEYRDCVVHFDVVCHTDYWNLGDYRLRPLKICGYIDGILNKTKLSGIGTFLFGGCNEMNFDNNLSGYNLMYNAIHGTDDVIERK